VLTYQTQDSEYKSTVLKKKRILRWCVSWLTPVISALERQRQENHELQVSLGFREISTCLKKTNKEF
jgi:hypothetical protein